MLRDVEQCSSLLFRGMETASGGSGGAGCRGTASSVLKQWERRLNITEASYKTRESVLYLHQMLLQLFSGYGDNNFQAVSDNLWLKIAKTARKYGSFVCLFLFLLDNT